MSVRTKAENNTKFALHAFSTLLTSELCERLRVGICADNSNSISGKSEFKFSAPQTEYAPYFGAFRLSRCWRAQSSALSSSFFCSCNQCTQGKNACTFASGNLVAAAVLSNWERPPQTTNQYQLWEKRGLFFP